MGQSIWIAARLPSTSTGVMMRPSFDCAEAARLMRYGPHALGRGGAIIASGGVEQEAPMSHALAAPITEAVDA